MASLKSMNVGLSNNGTAMNAQTEMTDGLLNACRLAGVDYETALKIKAYMPVSSHLTKPDAGGGEGVGKVVDADLMGNPIVRWKSKPTIGTQLYLAPPSDVPVEPSVVPMPEWMNRLQMEARLFAPMKSNFTLSRNELIEIFRYSETRVSEETRELVDGLRKAITQAEIRICTHDETHRGGAIWEICDQCGAKWADDEGGKPEFKWPEAIVELNALIAKYTQTQKESK
jgi:hypothetical protein